MTEKKQFDFTKFKGFLEHLKASDIMNPRVVTLKPYHSVQHAKELMRIKRISGIPIVDDDNVLVGIISIEDIIRCLESCVKVCSKDPLEEKIERWMTKNVKFFLENDSVEFILNLFKKFGYGRFPVVNGKKQVVGIITIEDIIYAFLIKFAQIYVHDERRTSILEDERSLLKQEHLSSKEADFLYNLSNVSIEEAGRGAATLKQFLKKLGFDDEIVRRVSIATYEAEVNAIIHSGADGKILAFIRDDAIIVRVEDYGRGIEDVDLAMREGYSTAPDYIRELGFGAGMGLPNMKRFSDKLVVLSEKGKGTIVEMRFELKGRNKEVH